MERLTGQTLREVLRASGKLEVEYSVGVVCEALETLAVLHERGVSHLDLKPENLFLTEEGRVVLLDFGLARRGAGGRTGETVTRRGDVPGIPRYMSPQQAQGLRGSPPDDVYAASSMLFELLTGESPFEIPPGANHLGVLNAIRQGPRCGPRALREDVPRALDRVLSAALEPEVGSRNGAGSAAELRETLLQALERGKKTSWFRRLFRGGVAPADPEESSREVDATSEVDRTAPASGKARRAKRKPRSERRPRVSSGRQPALPPESSVDEELLERVRGLSEFARLKPAGGLPRYRHKPTWLPFRLVPGGSFVMGSRAGSGSPWEWPAHLVTVEPFLLSEVPCTQAAWDRCQKRVSASDKRRFRGATQPVVGVSWEGAQAWCEAVGLRLPSEAEWEYACRAGSPHAYCHGDSVRSLVGYGWFDENSDGRTHGVRRLKPNVWGLYDMHGNVWEWCADDWVESHERAPERAQPPRRDPESTKRVCKGGGWGNVAAACRSAERSGNAPSSQFTNLGFRPAVSLP